MSVDGAAVPRTPTLVLLGMGGNMGDRLGELRAAVRALASHPDVKVISASGVWESEYVGPGDSQPDYWNACLAVSTDLEPRALLSVLKGIEQEQGRSRDGHMQPRPLDLDILLFGDLVLSENDLQIPHPRLRERAFVLEPLAQIAGEVTLPDSNETVSGVCEKIRHANGSRIRPVPDVNLLG